MGVRMVDTEEGGSPRQFPDLRRRRGKATPTPTPTPTPILPSPGWGWSWSWGWSCRISAAAAKRQSSPRRVLCAPNAFKGSLTAREAAAAMARGVRRAGAEAMLLPVADGGDGTAAVLGGRVRRT